MLDDKKFIQQSLISNLFFMRTIREFCTNIQLSFFGNNTSYIDIANNFGKRYEELGNEIIVIANGRITQEQLEDGTFITPFTLECELLTEELFNIDINTNITHIEMNLETSKNGDFEYDQETVDTLTRINSDAIILTDNFIEFCENILRNQKDYKLFSYSYPLIFIYMIEEANLYVNDLRRLNEKAGPDPTYVANFEYFFSDSMKSAAQFVAGLSDPQQTSIITNANNFKNIFSEMMKKYQETVLTPDSQKALNNETLQYVEKFQQFLTNVIKGILDKSLYFIIEPIFFDNLLTEANYFIHLLKSLRR